MVIKRVEELAKNQGFTVLKFANRRGNPIFDASLIAGVDYEENLVPPNTLDTEQEQEHEEENDESENTDNIELEEEGEYEIAKQWDKDEEDLKIQNESNQKIHYKDGYMVEDIEYLDDHNSDSEPESEDPINEEDQNPRSEIEDSEKSDDNEKDGQRRSKSSREPPERLNPTMTGQSYAIRKKNIEIKRKMKRDIKMRKKVQRRAL